MAVLEAGEKAEWVEFKASAFDQNDVFREGPLSLSEAKSLVEKHLDEVIGFSYHKDYPEYRWVVRRGTAKFRFQAGWTCMVYKVVLPRAKDELFCDDFAFTPQAFGSLDFGQGWARPGRGEGLADHLTDVDNIQSVDPNDLRQGGLGDCWLISSFAALAEFPAEVRKMVTPNVIAKDGKYTVNLFDYSQGKVVPTVVDDRIPLGQGGAARFTNLSRDSEIWPCIFEKAVAKLAGSYENLDGADPAFALGMLTGTPSCNMVEFMLVDGKWICLVPEFKSCNPHDPNNGMFYKNWPDGSPGSKGKHSAVVLKLLAEYSAKDYLMCAGSHAGSDKDLNSFGVVQGHAYTLLQVELNVAGSGRDMLQLRNPWGTGEWTGDWSDESPLWRRYPSVKKALDYDFADDGIFWLEAKDFFANYSSIMVCCKTMPKNRSKQEKEFKGKLLSETKAAAPKPAPPKPPMRKTQEAKAALCQSTKFVELPGAEKITASDGSTFTVCRTPGLSIQEWALVRATLEQKPEEAKRMEAFSKDSAAVRTWLRQQAVSEYYQSKIYAKDEEVCDKVNWLLRSPEFAFIFQEMQRSGVQATLEKYCANVPLMQRLNKALGGVPLEVATTLMKLDCAPVTLHEACKMGDLQAIQQHLAAAGIVDLEAKDSRGATCLAYAIGANRVAIVKLLLESKANVASCDSKGGTGLHYAAAYGRKELAEFLADASGAVNAKNEQGLTPLALATKNRQQEVVELLKKKGGQM